MRAVVALELEARAVGGAGLQDVFDVLEGVAKHQVASRLEVMPFPIELEILVAIEQVEQPEIGRAHVQRNQLGLEHGGRPHAFLDQHVGAAARGDVDDRVGLAVDRR